MKKAFSDPASSVSLPLPTPRVIRVPPLALATVPPEGAAVNCGHPANLSGLAMGRPHPSIRKVLVVEFMLVYSLLCVIFNFVSSASVQRENRRWRRGWQEGNIMFVFTRQPVVHHFASHPQVKPFLCALVFSSAQVAPGFMIVSSKRLKTQS